VAGIELPNDSGEVHARPRSIVAKTLTFLENNPSRMTYLQYRQQGLPITSCLMESLIKEINHGSVAKARSVFIERRDELPRQLGVPTATIAVEVPIRVLIFTGML